MKKYFYLAAVSAMMLTACSSDKDVLEPTPKPSTPTVVAQQQAVAFDTYLAGTTASTRAGDPEGVMTTDKLKTPGKGFGVLAYYQDEVNYADGVINPNFMYNEQVHWNNGWTYSPLKYWPNETTNDSQTNNGSAVMPGTISSPNLDKLSFFAYAPYVATGTSTLLNTTDDTYFGTGKGAWTGTTSGITAISREDYAGDPLVEWQYSDDIDKNVDLLWGVAPAGNLNYQAVNGTTINKAFGLPLLDLVKPDKDQKIKFLFNHALSRIGLTVVSAIDQIAAGDAGDKFKPNQTRVLIDEVKVWGDFGIKGTLNLNNTSANVAEWIDASIINSGSSEAYPMYEFSVANGKINPDLRYENISSVTGASDATAAATAFTALNPGVTPSEKLLLSSGPENGIPVTDLSYELGKKLYKENDSHDYVLATTTATADVDVFTKSGDDYTQVKAAGGGAITMSGETPEYWKATFTEEDASAEGKSIAIDAWYYVRTGSPGAYIYTYTQNTTGAAITTGNYYVLSDPAVLTAYDYSGDCYAKLASRYFMVIPSKTPADKTVVNTVNVQITYHVITNDSKLHGYVSDISNTITKTETIKLLSGKSYNLKLILGLTSVKLDATVADWQVGDDSEIFLPKNN